MPAPASTAFSILPLLPANLANLHRLGHAGMTAIQAAALLARS